MKTPRQQVIPLQPDNFTPLARTPWAGHVIGNTYKRDIVPNAARSPIGESWEFSCDPSFPSYLALDPEISLEECIRSDPKALLGDACVDAANPSCEILVKLLNADQPLSLQVHPADGDPNLSSDECGKPESWYILNAEKGAGIYLGFSTAVTKEELKSALLDGAKAKDLLHFVPTKPGDYFEIGPGVAHAVGPGVTLLEPQRIRFGFKGKTYRMWDWGRKYDATGNLDMQKGSPRELHVEASLNIVDPQVQIGEPFVANLRRSPEAHNHAYGQWNIFPANEYYQLLTYEAKEAGEIQLRGSAYGSLTILRGQVGSKMCPLMGTGQTGFVPNDAMPLQLDVAAGSWLAMVLPAGSFQGLA